MSDVIQTGKAYRILTDLANKTWTKISFWKKSSDVVFDNNNNLQTTCGSITGITDSLTSTSTTMCASANVIKQLNDKITALQSR